MSEICPNCQQIRPTIGRFCDICGTKTKYQRLWLALHYLAARFWLLVVVQMLLNSADYVSTAWALSLPPKFINNTLWMLSEANPLFVSIGVFTPLAVTIKLLASPFSVILPAVLMERMGRRWAHRNGFGILIVLPSIVQSIYVLSSNMFQLIQMLVATHGVL